MSRVHSNNFQTTLSSSCTNSDTTLSLTSLSGLPSVGSGAIGRLTITDGTLYEIVSFTGTGSGTITGVTRGLEGTTAQAWASGKTVMLNLTADSVDRKLDAPTTFTANRIIATGTSSTGATQILSAGSVGQPLLSNGSSLPNYGSLDLTSAVTGNLPVTNGGTGVGSLVAYSVLCGGTNNTNPVQALASVGTAGYVLTSNGAGALPTWQAVSGGGGGVSSVTGTSNRISSTGGSSPIIDIDAAYVGQSSITTLGTIATGTWSATSIGATKGGTGISSYAAGDMLYASATNTLSKLAAGANTYVLTMVAGVPAWAAPSGGGGSGTVNSATVNKLAYYSSTGTTVDGLATANNGLLVTNGSGVPSISSTLPNNLNMQAPSYIDLTNGQSLPLNGGISGFPFAMLNFLTAPSSANLLSTMTTKTGSGLNVFANSPAFTTPDLDVPSAGTLTNCTGLPLTTGTTGTLPVTKGGTGVTTSTGSGSVVLTNTPTITTPNLVGSTSGSLPAAGSIGEEISNSATNVPMTSNTVINITSISLTPGDWDVYGDVLSVPAGTTTQSSVVACISTTSATLDPGRYGILSGSVPAGLGQGANAPARRITVTSTTTVYLVAISVFAVSTMKMNAYIRARRRT